MKREKTCDGDTEGISFLREGCFCQFGRERMKESREVRWTDSGSGSGGRQEVMEEKKQRFLSEMIGAVSFLIISESDSFLFDWN